MFQIKRIYKRDALTTTPLFRISKKNDKILHTAAINLPNSTLKIY